MERVSLRSIARTGIARLAVASESPQSDVVHGFTIKRAVYGALVGVSRGLGASAASARHTSTGGDHESELKRFGNLEGYVRSPARGLGVADGDLT